MPTEIVTFEFTTNGNEVTISFQDEPLDVVESIALIGYDISYTGAPANHRVLVRLRDHQGQNLITHSNRRSGTENREHFVISTPTQDSHQDYAQPRIFYDDGHRASNRNIHELRLALIQTANLGNSVQNIQEAVIYLQVKWRHKDPKVTYHPNTLRHRQEAKHTPSELAKLTGPRRR